MIFNWIHGNIHTASYRLQLALSVKSLPHREQRGLCDNVQCWVSFCCRVTARLRGADGVCCEKTETRNADVQERRAPLPGWERVPCWPSDMCAAFRLRASQIVSSPTNCSCYFKLFASFPAAEALQVEFFQWHRVTSLLTAWKCNRVSTEV